jgi:hypothetical protein
LADYTEKATLLLIDKTSGNVAKINNSLRSLRKEALATQKALNTMGSARAAKNLSAQAKAMREFANAARRVPKTSSLGVKFKGASPKDINAMSKALGNYKTASKGLKGLIGAGGSTGSNFKGLDLLVTKLIRVARAAGLASNQLAKMKGNIPTGGGNIPGSRPPRTPPGMNPSPNGPRNIGLQLQPLKSLLRSFVVDLGHTIVSSIKDSFVEGLKGFDVASNKELQQRLTPDVRQQFENQAFAASRANPLLRPDQREDLYAEVSTNFKNPTDALKFDKSLDRIIQVSVQQGNTTQQAVEGIAQLFRGLGQAGYLVDNKGNFDPRANAYIDSLTAAKVSEGAQINFNDAFQLLKNAKTSGQSISPREFFFQLLAAADVGASTAGVQLNMATKTFTGETTKKAIAAQEAAGLRGPSTLVPTGKSGKSGATTYTLEGGDLKDAELFRENSTEWIRKYILGPDGFLAKQGIDLANANPATVINALDPLSGNRNSDDFLAKAVLQFQEAMIKATKYFDNPLTDKEIGDISKQSSFVQMMETQQQFTTMLGIAGDRLENTFIPVIDKIGNGFQWVSDLVQGRSKNQMQDYALVGGMAAGGVAAGLGTVGLLKWLSGATGLNTAAVALSASAAQLSAAAAALSGNALPGAGPNNGPGGGGVGNLMKIAAIGVQSYLLGSGIASDKKGVETQINNAKAWSQGVSAWLQKNIGTPRSWLGMSTDNSPAASAAVPLTMAQQVSQGYKTGNYTDALTAINNSNQSVEQLGTTVTAGSQEILSAFDTGSTKLGAAADAFGGTAANALMAIASAFGTQAGAAMRAAVGQLGVNVNQTPAAAVPNTGTNTNIQSGG